MALLDSGCGSLAIFFEEGTVQSTHYPEPYSNLADCQWIVHAPEDHVVKVQGREGLLESAQGGCWSKRWQMRHFVHLGVCFPIKGPRGMN